MNKTLYSLFCFPLLWKCNHYFHLVQNFFDKFEAKIIQIWTFTIFTIHTIVLASFSSNSNVAFHYQHVRLMRISLDLVQYYFFLSFCKFVLNFFISPSFTFVDSFFSSYFCLNPIWTILRLTPRV